MLIVTKSFFYMRVKTIFFIALIPFPAAFSVLAQTETYNGHEVAKQQVLLKLRNPNATILQQLRLSADADDLRPLNNALGLFVIHSRSASSTALLAALQNLPFVAYIEPDYIVKKSASPNDPSFSQQWSFLNTGTPGADISATPAWDLSTGSTVNAVGVVDTGL